MEAVRASNLAKSDSDRELTNKLRESTWDCICAITDGCEEGTESAEGGGEAEGLLRCFEEPFDFKDLRILAYKRISSSGHSMHSSQRDSTEQSKPLHTTQMVLRSAVFALILLGQATHLRRPSEGCSTEESDDGGAVGPARAVKPGSSKLISLITEKHKKGHEKGE